MSTKIQKIDYAVFHDPSLIPTLLRDCSIKKGIIYSRLRRAVPRRVGIEFECMGDPASTYKYGYGNKLSNKRDLAKRFHLIDYDQDPALARSEEVYLAQRAKLLLAKSRSERYSLDEIRVSIADYSQLTGLYQILKLIDNSCIKPIGGGIHIHVDFSDYQRQRTLVTCKHYIEHHLDEIEGIFPPYDGSYNKREVGIHHKSTYVNLSCHGSIEFRIAPLTFDYETLIRWIVDLNKFVTKMIHECHLLTDEQIAKREKKNREKELGDPSTYDLLSRFANRVSDYGLVDSDINAVVLDHATRLIGNYADEPYAPDDPDDTVTDPGTTASDLDQIASEDITAYAEIMRRITELQEQYRVEHAGRISYNREREYIEEMNALRNMLDRLENRARSNQTYYDIEFDHYTNLNSNGDYYIAGYNSTNGRRHSVRFLRSSDWS